MARGTQRKTERVEVNDPRVNDPRIGEHTRFINARGNRNGEQAAAALQEAFSVGSRFAHDVKVRRNEEGVDRALTSRASGAERDTDDTNFGYNQAWDKLDAEYDFNIVQKELPELLRGFDAENKTEAEVQGFISDYMASQFGGIEDLGDSEYAKALAPQLLGFEALMLAGHRDSQIEKIREEQRGKLTANFQNAYVETGALDYQKLFDETGVFFEGSDKKVVMWETLYDIAIKAGDPDLIRNMPEQINGIPTGITDPKLLDEHRAAVAQATSVAARELAAAEAQLKAENKQSVFDTQLLIAERAFNEEPYGDLVMQMRNNPEATYSDLTSAANFGQAQLSKFEGRSMKLPETAELWSAIYSGQASLSHVMDAYAAATLGGGPQAMEEARQMMAAVTAQQQASQRGNSVSLGTYRTEIASVYNPQRQGPFGGLDNKLLDIRTEAVSEYNRLTLEENMSPREARDQVRDQFDAAVDRIKPESLAEAGSSSQSATARAQGLTMTPSHVNRFVSGEIDLAEFVGPRTEEELYIQLRIMDLTIDEQEAIARKLKP